MTPGTFATSGLEAPPPEETPLDGGIEEPESGEPVEETEPSRDEGTTEASDKTAAAAGPAIVDGKLAPGYQKIVEQVRASDPHAARQIRSALFQADRIARELPGGLKEISAMRATIEELGGETGIQDLRAELDGWAKFDADYTAGKPDAIDFMTGSEEGKVSFLKLAPLAFDKYAELNPDGYSSYVARVLVGDLQSAGVPVALERLQDFIADNPKAMAAWKQIADYVNRLGEISRKAVAPPKAASVDNGRATELDQREAKLARDEWQRETAQTQNQVYQSEFARLAANRKLTEVQREDILHRVKTKLDLRVQSEKAKLDRMFASRDREGFRRFTDAFSKREIPALLREAFDRYVPTKAKVAPGATNGTTQAAAKGSLDKGFTEIAQRPASGEIDYSHPFNTTTNFSAGKAVLRDGRKVQWRR